MDLEDLTLDDFRTRLGDHFRVDLEDGGSVDFELTEAEPARTGQSDGGESFSLLFRGPVEPAMGQSILPLRHEAMGTVEMFVVPIHQDEAGTTYEAVFNRSS